MVRIERKLNFFKRNFNLIFGVFWSAMGISYLLINLDENDSRLFNWLMGCGYLLIGLGYFYMSFKNGSKKGEYIEWNDEELNYKQNLGKLHSYKLNRLIDLTVAEHNLIIKAPNSKGTMAPLKGYSEDDLEKLRKRFGAS